MSAQRSMTGSNAETNLGDRLRSIVFDTEFVREAERRYGLPLIVNERCGEWYVPSSHIAGRVYFKSTDGHAGYWKFSSRRLNLHLLKIIGEHNGCILVDSTTERKVMPDAFSRTVPIWCAVINQVLFPDRKDCHRLETPPDVVSVEEHEAITQMLPSFLSQFLALEREIESLKAILTSPLLPVWIGPDRDAPSLNCESSQLPVILCTASCQNGQTTTGMSGRYIKGAGDDSENWALGLSPQMFWEHYSELIGLRTEVLHQRVKSLVMHKANDLSTIQLPVAIHPVQRLFVASNAVLRKPEVITRFNAIISCGRGSEEQAAKSEKCKLLHVECRPGKVGSRDLRKELPKVCNFVDGLASLASPEVLLCCQSGRDFSIGIAVVILCRHATADGRLRLDKANRALDKVFVRQRLGWVISSMPSANPSRATMQSVHAFLLERPAGTRGNGRPI